MHKNIIIAIDGHSSTGKSTVAKVIAKQFSYTYVDTGAMYRAVAYYAIQHSMIDHDGKTINAEIIKSLPKIHIEFKNENETFLNGVSVEKEIRSIEVAKVVSAVSAIAEVRTAMVQLQQAMGHNKGVVMDGRDIATVVFPNAELKIFMTADPLVRAQRRYDELIAKGEQVKFDEILKNVQERDLADSTRANSPLKQASDAILLDNTLMTREEQIDWIAERVKQLTSCNTNMKVVIDDKSGFCYGVIKAIDTAEKELKDGEILYSLGEIVHNNIEVERLTAKGLSTVGIDQMKDLKGKKLLIRAHGEPPSTYTAAANAQIEIVDCTCPVVLKLQDRIKKAYQQAVTENGQVVIFGKRGHAEVNGLVGQTDNQAIVLQYIAEVDTLDFTRPIYLFSQTTMSKEDFETLKDLISQKIQQAKGDLNKYKAYNTTCGQVTGRQPHLKTFAKQFDVIIFVSGKQSSNGKVLYQTCKEQNPLTYFIERPADIDSSWFVGQSTVGICGATSTPRWLMEEVEVAIKLIVNC